MAILFLLVAVVLAVAEAFTGTFVLLMFSTGALAAALAAALDAPIPLQLLVFTVVSVLALVGVRPVIRSRLHRNGDEPSMGLAAIEGAEGNVLEQVDAEHGLVKIDGEIWRALAYDATQVIPPGERVRVIEIRGATAMVWREK